MEEKVQCPVCQSAAPPCYIVHGSNSQYVRCPVCGKYEWCVEDDRDFLNMNQLPAYLAYHARDPKISSFYTTRAKGEKSYLFSLNDNREEDFFHPLYIDADIITSWYPKSFAEKIDLILLYIFNHTSHLGQSVHFSAEQLYSFLFVDRYEWSSSKYVLRPQNDLQQEGVFMLKCLAERKYIPDYIGLHCDHTQDITLMPSAYARIDEIQKNTSNGRNVLVAMKFGDDTKPLREAIRKGVQDAKYHAIFIDEVQHNDFITPELLKHIRDSKFVVVDLTHQNNGAYFEEGYAMGLGKPVIQLCKKGTQLHFDIAQKNTIMWASEDDIPELLRNRIVATIE